jgi:hypothetical protein
MENPAVISAKWWVYFWETVEHWAFLAVVLTIAIQFAAQHFLKSPRKIVDDARQIEVMQLTKDAETARAQIAEAQARTTEAQARLETLRRQLGKRFPDRQAMVPLLREAPASVEIDYSKEDMDSIMVVMELKSALTDAGWTVTAVLPLPAEELLRRKVPSTAWWYIEAHSIPEDGLMRGTQIGLNLSTPPGTVKTPLDALVAGLLRGLGAPAIVTGATVNPSLEEGHFRLFIMPR